MGGKRTWIDQYRHFHASEVLAKRGSVSSNQKRTKQNKKAVLQGHICLTSWNQLKSSEIH